MLVKSDKTSFESYLSDAANIKGDCDKVYFPEYNYDLIAIVEEARDKGKRLTISASRTGLNGGSVPNNGILISTEKLNKFLSIDEPTNSIWVQPGLTLDELQIILDQYGYFYPPDPTELNCSIGGTVANNASGARTFKYGPTRNFVEAIKVILVSGEELEIKRGDYISNGLLFKFELRDNKQFHFTIPDYKMPLVKHSAGYYCSPNMDLIDLFIGSEGTLGIISEIKLKILKKPKSVVSMIIFFESEKNLFSFIQEIRERTIDTNNLLDLREIEFFDKNTLQLLMEDYSNIPNSSQGAVWIEQEINGDHEDNLINDINDLIQKHKGNEENLWFAFNDSEREKLKEFRHKIALKVNDIISSRGLVKVGTDTAVPDDKFVDFYTFTKSLIENNNIDYVVYGHIGNSHLHFNMLPKSIQELELCRHLYGKICSKSIEFEGTISAEHGIGKLKTKYLLEMFGEENIIKMAKLKKTFDPNMILNIGNIFDEKFLKLV